MTPRNVKIYRALLAATLGGVTFAVLAGVGPTHPRPIPGPVGATGTAPSTAPPTTTATVNRTPETVASTTPATLRAGDETGTEGVRSGGSPVPTTTQPAPPPPAPTTTTTSPPPVQAGEPTDEQWYQLFGCETGYKYDPAIHSPTGQYHGAFQFDLQTWVSAGGSGDPHTHTYEEQRETAKVLWRMRGWSPWPRCSSKLGFR
jgi:hypothetical protein